MFAIVKIHLVWYHTTERRYRKRRQKSNQQSDMFDWKTDSLAVFGIDVESRTLGKGRPSSAAACSTRKPPPELSAPEASMIQQGSRGTRTSTCSIPWAAKGGGK